MELLIFTPNGSLSRIHYTMEFVFCSVLKIESISFTSDPETFISFNGRRLNYSNVEFQCECLDIPPSGLLFSSGYQNIRLDIEERASLPYLVYDKQSGIDPFSGIFFMISRYEEYESFSVDVHGRFPASESIAYRHNFLEFPIVDAWIDWIRKQMNKTFPKLPPITVPGYHFTATYDIDHVRAYLWKGFLRSVGSMAKDVFAMNGGLQQRLKVLMGRENDMYNVFSLFDDWHEKYDLSPVYFWLLGDFGNFDKNPDVRHPHFRKEIQKTADRYDVGIHPSYASFMNRAQIKKEVDRLGEIISVGNIDKNRFHFLRFRLPDSYRMLINLGITKDYSMAFPDAPGFRAGTSHPFYWYDLERETATSLKIHPFQVMDVTLKNYLQLTPEESIDKAGEIIGNIKKYGGHFISLWHNSSFDEKEWKGWRVVYEDILKMATD